MVEEVWKATPGYEGFYEVSNLGRVKRTAPAPHTHPGKILKLRANRRHGYVVAHVSCNSIPSAFRVHRAVAEAFVPNGDPETKTQINHKDGDKTNNRADNLEWVDARENMQHAFRTGLAQGPRGEKCGTSKLTEGQVREIRALKGAMLQRDIALQFGISKAQVCNILKGNRWAHLD